VPTVALAHGAANPAPTPSILITGWQIDPIFIMLTLLASWAYLRAVQAVNAAHPNSPFPRKRVAYFFSGIGILVFALISPFAAYDTDLFALHMWQHILLISFAAPFLVLSTPLTLALRAANPRVRREVLLPILHSRVVRAITFPVIAWVGLSFAMWGSHFSPIYNLSLENTWFHRVEHVWYLSAALLFWWQVIGVDPTPWRMSYPVRILYLFLQMPQNSFLALSFYNSEHIIYKHYDALVRTWGPNPLLDQELAGITMWVGGDLIFLGALALVIVQWVKHEELENKRADRQQARAKAARAASEASATGMAR